MDLDVRLMVLEKIYELYEEFIADNSFICQKHCAHCCTRNVTMTTLEGYYLLDQLDDSEKTKFMQKIQQQAKEKRFVPKVTINHMADLCAKGQELPEEEIDASWGQCPVLDEDICPLYVKRPFGCRCMFSLQKCAESGFADIPAWVLSANNIIMQYIEHVDATGFSGNFTDVMLFFNDHENYTGYSQDRPIERPENLLANQPVYILMVPPEDRGRLEPLLKGIKSIKVPAK